MVFKFLWSKGGERLESIEAKVQAMLGHSRYEFDLAMSALLGDTVAQEVNGDLRSTDQKVNQLERDIRRELVIHSSVFGGIESPAVLIYISIAGGRLRKEPPRPRFGCGSERFGLRPLGTAPSRLDRGSFARPINGCPLTATTRSAGDPSDARAAPRADRRGAVLRRSPRYLHAREAACACPEWWCGRPDSRG